MRCEGIEPIRTSEIMIFPPGLRLPDLDYQRLCDSWCQWLVSMPRTSNPTLQEYTGIEQHIAPVPKTVFLCQHFDFQGKPKKSEEPITIPEDWKIFMPIINWVFCLESKNSMEVEDFANLSREKMDEAASLRLSVNEKSVNLNLRDFRFRSNVSNVTIPHDNIFDMEPGSAFIVADGFWIFFQPLVKDLTIETFGTCQMGATQISGKYHLILDK